MTISAGPGSAGTAGAGAAADMIVQRDLSVPADDGFGVRTDVLGPSGSGPFPAIMSFRPDGKSLPFQSEWFASRWERLLAGHPDVAEGSSCAHMNWETVDPERWIPTDRTVAGYETESVPAVWLGIQQTTAGETASQPVGCLLVRV